MQAGVADPDPVLFWPLDPGSGMGKNPGLDILDHISESLVKIFWGWKYLNSLTRIRIRPGMENSGGGINSRIRNTGVSRF